MEELWHMAVMENIQKAEQKSKKKIEQGKQKSLELAEDLRRQREEREQRIREQEQRKRDEEVSTIKKIVMDESAAEKVSTINSCLSFDMHFMKLYFADAFISFTG